jgi:WD40 repeat protein
MEVAHTLTLEFSRAEQVEDAHVFRSAPQAYILRRDRGFGSATFPWGDQVRAELAELEKLQPEPGVVQGLGDTLRSFVEESLRSLEGWGHHEDAIRQAIDAGKTVHVTFRFAAAELYALPWELVTLRSTGQYLGELKACLVQYEWPGTSTAPERLTPPPEQGRLLFGWSAAGGAVPAAEHLRALSEAGARGEFDPGSDILPDLSLAALERTLEEASSSGRPVAALHLLCHGGATEGGTWGLLWSGSRPDGQPELIDGASLRRALAPYRDSLRLVVLCACRSGHSPPGNSLGSICQALHRIGIQAVVASRLPMSKRGSVQFAEAFYGALLAGTASLQQAFLSARSRLAQLAGYEWVALQLYARAEDGTDQRPLVFCPFPGLECFEEENAPFYFGRDAEIREAMACFEPAAPIPRRWLQVEGPSGAGKSSFVRAGLVPAIRRGGIKGGPERWRVGVLRPGRDPLQQLSIALIDLLGWGDRPEGPRELEALLREPGGLRMLLSREARPGTGLLLVVDQLEEVFALPQSDAGGKAHFDALLAQALDGVGPLHLITTIRSDFLGRFTELPRLESLLNSKTARYYLRQMTSQSLVGAFMESAAAAGLAWEAGLPGRITADAAEASGSLPLVGHTLRELWKRRSGRMLTHAAYLELGGVRGALTLSAEVLLGTFSPEEKERIRKLFLDMVTSGRGTRDVRRVVPLEEAVRIAGGGTEGQALIARLSGGRAPDASPTSPAPPRLLVVGEDTADLAHEALLDDWQTLRGWIDAERKNLERRDDLEAAAAVWLSGGSHEDGLPSGGQLAYLRSAEPVTERARAFLEAALAREQRELERRQRKARSARLRLGLVAAAAAAVAVVMGGLWREAVASGARARTSALLSGAGQQLVGGDPAVADRLLLEVSEPERAQGWMALAHEVLLLPMPKVTFRHGEPILGAWFSRDGRWVLTMSGDGAVRVWPADGRGPARVLKGHAGQVWSVQDAVSLSADGQRVVSGASDGTVRVSRVDGEGEPVVLKGHTGAVRCAAFSPDGQLVATGAEDAQVRVWRVDGKDQAVVLEGHSSKVIWVAFSPDGERVVTASRDGTARVWRADGQGAPVVLKGHAHELWYAQFSPDGKRVLTASFDKTARVWRADGEGEPVVLAGHQGAVEFASFSPDGERVVTVSRDGTARIWWADGRERAVVLEGHSGPISVATFSPDGQRVVTGAGDGTARIWKLDGTEALTVLRAHSGGVTTATYSPDGRWVLTGSQDGTARVWRADGRGEMVMLKGHSATLTSVTFSRDGEWMVTASQDGTARVWRADGTGEPVVLRGHTSEVSSAAFSPDGKRVATASRDWTARVWRADGTGEPVVFRGHTDTVRSVAFSPDGELVVTASVDGTAQVWRVDGTGEPVVLKGHAGVVWAAAFSPDGERVVTASVDGTGRVWRVDGTKEPIILRGHSGHVRSAAFSPDGAWVATASQDGTARVWRADGTGEPVVLKGHGGKVISVGFSPDGQRVVTASFDGTARVWKVDGTGEPLVLRAYSGGVRYAAFSPDGGRVVTASEMMARVWTLSVSALRQQLSRANMDCLTPEQRQNYLSETESTARKKYEDCERSFGRMPGG